MVSPEVLNSSEINNNLVETVRLVISRKEKNKVKFLFIKKSYLDAYNKQRYFFDLPLVSTEGEEPEKVLVSKEVEFLARTLGCNFGKIRKIWESTPEIVSLRHQLPKFSTEAFYEVKAALPARNFDEFHFFSPEEASSLDIPEVTREFCKWYSDNKLNNWIAKSEQDSNNLIER